MTSSISIYIYVLMRDAKDDQQIEGPKSHWHVSRSLLLCGYITTLCVLRMYTTNHLLSVMLI